MGNLRSKLKQCQPYFIEHDLLPQMYFKEDEKDTEYWIFKYIFIHGLSDLATGIRLGYDRHQIYRLTIKILDKNRTLVSDFLDAQISTTN